MTVLRGFGIVFVSTLLGALIGLGVGYGLGIAAPSYYRTIFRDGNSPNFDPVQVGIGGGLTQGLMTGVVVGCVIVLAVAWHNSRRQVAAQEIASHKWRQPTSHVTTGEPPT